MPIPKILRDLLGIPTASFVEQYILAYLEQACSKLPGVSLQSDRYGNLLATYRNKPPKTTPVAFSAHMDHPGFVSIEMRDDRHVLADFRGWVESSYFLGSKVRFWSRDHWVSGTVVDILKEVDAYRMIGRTARPEQVLVRVVGPVAPNSPGMWDLPEPLEAEGRVHARGCDDVAGVAALLALLDRLSKANASAEVHCLFTRAEEVGFIGAIGAAKAHTIGKKTPIIAIETSKELANAKQGDGPILRVGDKSSVFTPALTNFCERVAKRLGEERKEFMWQRKLMDGGTCESTAYLAYGYEATGICVALANYHNMDTQRQKIASESVHLRDWKNMVDWFEAIVLDPVGYEPGKADSMRDDFDQRFDKSLHLLTGKTAAPEKPAKRKRATVA